MPLDPRLEPVLAMLPKQDPSIPAAQRRVEGQERAKQNAGVLSSAAAPLDERDEVVPSADGGVPVRIYRPRDGVLPCLINVHGGGWWLGTLDESDGGCRRRAVGAGCVVISIDYRLAPEHPFPAAVDDCWAAVQWVFANTEALGIDPARIAITGGSAGGNLAATMTHLARDAGLRFVAQVLEVPATDLTMQVGQGSINEFADGYFLTKADLIECISFYVGDGDAADPRISPLFGELHDLPPALITTMEFDPVRDEGEAYAAKLKAAGNRVTLRRWDGLVHGASEVDVLLPDVAEAYRAELFAFLQAAFAG